MNTPKKPAAKKPAAAKPHAAARKRPVKKADHAPKEAVHTETTPAAEHVRKPAIKHATTQNFYAVGKRKTAVAQAIISSGNGTITINELPLSTYFSTLDLQRIVQNPLVSLGIDKNINVRAKIHGGGIHAQAESLRHAISRAVTALDPESRRTLKKLGFLTRDPRVKERKKPGLKRARRAPQFSKR